MTGMARFPRSVMEYSTLGNYPGNPVSVVLYESVMALMALGFTLMRWPVLRHAGLLEETVSVSLFRKGTVLSLFFGPMCERAGNGRIVSKMGGRNWEGVPDAAHGARSTVYAALSPAKEGVSGKYNYLEREEPAVSAAARDEALAGKPRVHFQTPGRSMTGYFMLLERTSSSSFR